MFRFGKLLTLALMAGAGLASFPAMASAQIIAVYQNPTPVVTYYQTQIPVYQAPVAAPVVAPNVTYSYYPSTTVYSAPAPQLPLQATNVYSPATVATTGYVTRRTYFGLGILRPLGWNTESRYTPTGVIVNPPQVTTYYTPVLP